MSDQIPNDVQQSITSYVSNGVFPNEQAVLRAAIRSLDHQQEDLASIQRGLDDIANGRFEEAQKSNEAFRRLHSIPHAEEPLGQ